MNQMVDKIIEINFEELYSINFPKSGRFGLIVYLNNVKYEFLLNLIEDSDKLITVGSGALNINNDWDRLRPRCNRWSWDFEDSTIHYNDPTLYINDEILICWGIGTENDWYLKNISNMIEIIANSLNINENHLIHYGSSAGGFTSLMLSILIKGSVAIAEIPQFDITTYGPTRHWVYIKKYGFSDKSDEELFSKYGYRFKVIELIKKENYIPNAFCIVDVTENKFKSQTRNFFMQLNTLPFDKKSNSIKFLAYGKNEGHMNLTKEEILPLINNIKLILDNNSMHVEFKQKKQYNSFKINEKLDDKPFYFIEEIFNSTDFNIYLNKEFEDFNNVLIEDNKLKISHDLIKKSNLFDESFYLSSYPDVNNYEFDAIYHYLNIGVYEGCIPNPNFDLEEYSKEVNYEFNGLNPFVHYLINYSVDFEKDMLNSILNSLNKNIISYDDSFNIMNAFKQRVTIVIPIYNAYEDTKKCIKSVFKNTSIDFDLYLIDDASPDECISLLLNQYENYDNVYIIRNETNKGFTKNVNIGLTSTDSDVILLNSDTIVTPKWVQKFLFAAYSDEKIGTVTPISNASDIAVPKMGETNEIPNFLTINEMGSLVEKVSFNGNMGAPTGNGFCLFIKRALINDIGLFDDNTFDRGYGEETDFTQRAVKAGWKNVRNDSILIYHKRSASFSLTDVSDLKSKHKLVLKERYPNVFDEWNEFIESDILNNTIKSINYALDNFNEYLVKKNVLYITILEENKPLVDDIDKLNDKFNMFYLTLHKNEVSLWYYFNNKFILLKTLKFNKLIPNFGIFNQFYINLFINLNIDLVLLRFNPRLGIRYAQNILPIIFSHDIGIPCIHGLNTMKMLELLDEDRQNNIFINPKKEKGVIYTAIFGNYEALLDPKVVNPDLDYICFTDDVNLKSDVWDIRLINDLDDFEEINKLDYTRRARAFKTLPHKYLNDYDFSIWVDAAFLIIGDLIEYVNKFAKNGIVLGITHSIRDCIYDELEACVGKSKDDEELMRSQVEFYKNDGFPKHYGLIESGFLFRRHNNLKVKQVMDDWNYAVMTYSKRDQLSFDYVCWKNNFEYDKVSLFYWKNPYIEHYNHIKWVPQNKVTINKIRFIILNTECNYENTLESINKINFINPNIPISIFNWDNNQFFQEYNVENVVINNDNFESKFNELVNTKTEDFICIINSGDFVEYISIVELLNLYKNGISDVGAIIFEEINKNTGIHSFKERFSINDYISGSSKLNSIFLNRKLLCNSFYVFDKNFIKNIILDLFNNDLKVIKSNQIGLKINE